MQDEVDQVGKRYRSHIIDHRELARRWKRLRGRDQMDRHLLPDEFPPLRIEIAGQSQMLGEVCQGFGHKHIHV